MTEPRSQGRLTPHDIRQVTFPPSRFGSRGYREADVDAFVDLVADVLADRDRAIAREREEVHRVKDWRRAHGMAEQGTRTPSPEEVHLYSRAQLRAEALEARAEQIVVQAEAAAQQRFTEILQRAGEQAKVLGVHATVIRAQLEAQLQRLIQDIHTLGQPIQPDTEMPPPQHLPGTHRIHD
ncbi:DivIVA domain-containing protein [Amycolatopsis nigrescens]|uniref:DivIVA domain-containing protein n=1 Tax=Amycolatopsis nigrescens TaxID=381445 RepID=UPI00036E382D|nr:DivIVA domain-containing protein [Amycolatopsis nigrescens]